jgi:DNA-binding NarL/FixJ family response regulator
MFDGMTVMESPTLDEIDLRPLDPSDGPEAIDEIAVDVPDVVVVSLTGPIHPLRLCRAVADRAPVTRVLVRAGAEQAANSYQAIRIGAWGWIDENATPAEVDDAAKAVARGEAVLPGRHAAWVLRELDDSADAPGAPPSADQITAAERTVLQLLAQGADPESIGDHLGVSARVVGRHVGSAVARLHRRYRRPSSPPLRD